MSEAFVYIISLEDSGLFYIGSTSNLKVRLARHFNELNDGKHHNLILQSAWNNGEKKVLINTFTLNSRMAAYDFEQDLIKKAANSDRAYLLTNIGVNSRGGDNLTRHPHKEDILIKRSFRTVSNVLDKEERRLKYGKPGNLNPMFGKSHSSETKKKISEKLKGHSFNKGIKLSLEHIEKIRERQKLRIGNKNSFYGKRHTELTKQYLREINKGKVPSNIIAISANGLTFTSCAEAARYFKISQSLVTYRIKNTKYQDWFYINTVSNN